MNTPIGDKLFQDIPRRVANFRENRPRDVENLVDGIKLKKTRMLAINVSIPNLTVARLEQSLSSIRVHLQLMQPPKLVAMATSLRPSISGMSSLDSLTWKTYPWNKTASR